MVLRIKILPIGFVSQESLSLWPADTFVKRSLTVPLQRAGPTPQGTGSPRQPPNTCEHLTTPQRLNNSHLRTASCKLPLPTQSSYLVNHPLVLHPTTYLTQKALCSSPFLCTALPASWEKTSRTLLALFYFPIKLWKEDNQQNQTTAWVHFSFYLSGQSELSFQGWGEGMRLCTTNPRNI